MFKTCQIVRQIDKEIDRKIDRQIDRQIDIQIVPRIPDISTIHLSKSDNQRKSDK